MSDATPAVTPQLDDVVSDTVYLDALKEHYTPEDFVGNLTRAVNEYSRVQHNEANTYIVHGTDPVLDRIKYDARTAVEGVVAEADARIADIQQRVLGGMLTPRGQQAEQADISSKRAASLKSITEPLRQQLKAAAEQNAKELTATRPTVTPEHREAASSLMWEVAPMAPGQQLEQFTRFITEAITEQDFGRAVAVLPYLQTLEADPRLHSVAGAIGTIKSLIAAVYAASITGKHLIVKTKGERIERLQYELDQLTRVAHRNGAETLQWLANQPGWQFKQPPPIVRDVHGDRGPLKAATTATFRRIHLTPEQRKAADDERRKRGSE